MAETDEYSESDESVMEISRDEILPGATGLALADYYFGPLVSPVAATPVQWAAYIQHRLGANAEYRNVFSHRTPSISDAVAVIEYELSLDYGTLQKCVSILERHIDMDGTHVRNADILARIYSPAAPKYIDVHIRYHCRCQMFGTEWYYSLGYKIYSHVSGSPTAHHHPSTHGAPFMWHSRDGWKPICWGYYDDDGTYDRRLRRMEAGEMGVHEAGAIDIHEALFGSIGKPPSYDVDAILSYRRELVTTVRLLLAAVGIYYEVACTDEEYDEGPRDYMLEGLSDKWVARGIRAACGFQLRGDAEAEKHGEQERQEQAKRREDDGCDDDSSDSGYY